MVRKSLHTLAILPLTFGSLLGLNNDQGFISPYVGPYLLAEHKISLDNRQEDRFVNNVFKENILLNLAYLRGTVTKASDIDWNEVTKPFTYEFRLDPNQTFAYHNDVKERYKNSLVKTTNAHFNAREGFKTDGYLFGDGVCHLASLIYWAALDAKLTTEAPTNHNFAAIAGIDKKFGVSIYSNPNSTGSNTQQNLYITNNRMKPISFKFEYQNNAVKVSIIQIN